VLLALMLFTQGPEPVRIEVSREGEACVTRVIGAPLAPVPLEQAAREWARKGWPVRIVGLADTPYRCAGGTIFALQRAGYAGASGDAASTLDMRMTATIRLKVPRGKCVPTVDGTPVSLAEFQALAREWRRYQPQIHFQPDPRAPYRCVDKMLGLLKQAGVANMGFVGNEQYDPGLK